MTASPVLGIDLGTTNSVVAVADASQVVVLPDGDGECLTPSAVSFHPSGEVLVGRKARDRRMVDAKNTVVSVKRLIGRPYRSPEVRQAAARLPFELLEGARGGVMVRARGEAYSLPEISAFVLRKLKSVAEDGLGQSCVHAVVTVPANFSELQRTATRDAGRIAGLNVLRILNEPTAAALAYGYGNHMRKRVAIYDFGGGTFDVSILDLSGDVIEVIGTAGDSYLGGDDVDNLVAGRLSDAFLREHRLDLNDDPQASTRIRMAAEWLKCCLSTQSQATANLEEIAYQNKGKSINFEFELSRAELEQLAAPLFGRTFDICEQAMKVAGVRPAQLDAVVLVGGQTRSPQLRQMVAQYFGKTPLSSVDPDQVVAQGAALQAMSLAGGKQTVSLKAHAVRDEVQAVQRASSQPSKQPDGGFDEAPTRVSVRPMAVPGGTAVPPPSGVPHRAEPKVEPSRQKVDDSRGLEPSVGAPDTSVPPPASGEPGNRRGRAPVRTKSGFGELEPEAQLAARVRASRAPKPPPLSEILSAAAAPGQTIGRVALKSASPPAPVPASGLPAIRTRKQGGSSGPPPVPPSVRSSSSPSGPRPKKSPTQGLEPTSAALEVPAAPPPEFDLGGAEKRVEGVMFGESLAPSIDVTVSSIPPALMVANSASATEVPGAPLVPRELQVPSESVVAGASEPSHVPALHAQGTDTLGSTSSSPTSEEVEPGVSGTSAQAAMSVGQRSAKPVRAPLLLDVTPMSLAIETAGGFCEPVIARNSPIPTEQARVFCTSQDNQTEVTMRISQGEARASDDNQELGTLQLVGLRPGARGEVQVGVVFLLDADGTLRAKAIDHANRTAQEVRINLVGALTDEEIAQLRARQDVQYEGGA